jgi:hypothetical protein
MKLMSKMVKELLTNVDSFDTDGRAKMNSQMEHKHLKLPETKRYGQLCEQEQEQALIVEALTALARIANPEAIYYLESMLLSDNPRLKNSASKRLEGANHGTY